MSLRKLIIKVYEDKRCSDRFVGMIKLPVNPESYSESLKNEYDRKRGQGNQGTNPKYKSSPPTQIKLDFILDGTNTIEGYDPIDENGRGVHFDVEILKSFLYKKGNNLKPYYLKILWGRKQAFCSVLTSLDVNYTLFNPEGEPLRAKVSASFLEYREVRRAANERFHPGSAATRFLTSDASSNLGSASQRAFNDQNRILDLARANDLSNIRNIPPNLTLIIPALSNILNP